MITEEAKQRYNQLQEELGMFEEMGISPRQKLMGKLNSISLALNDLKTLLHNRAFATNEEEIEFFKYIKPQFAAARLFAIEKFTIESAKPVGDADELRNYYQKELNAIRFFFEKYRFMYQYYLLDGWELDATYFMRGKQSVTMFIAEVPDLDSEFSTAGDHLFARFKAYELLQDFLMTCLYPPLKKERRYFLTKKGNRLQWTGDKSDLIELAYGIYDTMQINYGDITIAEIIEWLEETFDIDLSRYHQVFTEIKNRKSVSRTRYIDHIKAMLILHMEEGDAFRPKKPKHVSGSKSIHPK